MSKKNRILACKPTPIHVNPIEFKGECIGIRLVQRGDKDRHICFQLLIEDDGYWYEMSEHSQPSSYWISDLQNVLKKANAWIKKNCDKDECGYGYNFK